MNKRNTARFAFALTLLTCAIGSVRAQKSDHIYDFLELSPSAHATALGGTQVAMGGYEVSQLFQNPSAMADTTHNNLALNITPYVEEIKYGTAAYCWHLENIGNVGGGFQFISYGDFDRTDENGTELGTFTASEYAIYLTFSKQLTPQLTMGATLKPVFSKFDNYDSFGLMMDFGVTYRSVNKRFVAGAAIKNLGSQITEYEEKHEKLPTDVKVGLSYKAEHAPFRISLTLKDLTEWNLSTDDDNKISFGDNLMRHTIFGVEMLPFRNFYVGVGYNHRIRKEMVASDKKGATGFSWGFGLKIYKFHIAYGSARHHIAGSCNSISLSTNLSSFL